MLPPLESETQVACLADTAACHLRRFVLVPRELGRLAAKLLHRSPWHGGREPRRDWIEFQTAAFVLSFKSNNMSCEISSTSSAIPSPVRQLVKTNGFSPLIIFESRRMTSRLASTYGAISILLMTKTSDWEIPGPFLRGILSPAATSIT